MAANVAEESTASIYRILNKIEFLSFRSDFGFEPRRLNNFDVSAKISLPKRARAKKQSEDLVFISHALDNYNNIRKSQNRDCW